MSGARSAFAFGIGAAACLTAAAAGAHPTDAEIARAREERRLCAEPPSAEAHLDPARLGMDEKSLRARFGEALSEATQPASGADKARPAPPPDGPGGLDAPPVRRLRRDASGDLATVDYELWEGRVYRIRWRLAPRFERPVLDALAERARTCFGRPALDQTFPAEPGSGHATYRRIAWRHGDRRIELRQLHPLRGGPVHFVVSSHSVLRTLRDAGALPPPLPDATAPWWARGAAPVIPAPPEETEALGLAFLRLLAHADHGVHSEPEASGVERANDRAREGEAPVPARASARR